MPPGRLTHCMALRAQAKFLIDVPDFALLEQRRYLQCGSSRGEIVWLKEGVVNAARS